MDPKINRRHEILNVLYRDDFLVVVDKPTGLLSVPGRTEDKKICVVSHLEAMEFRPLVIHRLDRDTSGVIVFALDAQTQVHVSRLFEQRLVRKTYVAEVSGRIEEESGTIDLPIRKSMSSSLPPRYRVDPEHGKHATTDWRVLSRTAGTTRLMLKPRTGRSHQLRVHCVSMGTPIVGDPIYGGDAADRMMLHASELSFGHPQSNEEKTFTSHVPF